MSHHHELIAESHLPNKRAFHPYLPLLISAVVKECCHFVADHLRSCHVSEITRFNYHKLKPTSIRLRISVPVRKILPIKLRALFVIRFSFSFVFITVPFNFACSPAIRAKYGHISSAFITYL